MDKSGKLMILFLEEVGYYIVVYEIVKDEKDVLQWVVFVGCMDEQIDVVFLNGGIGIVN